MHVIYKSALSYFNQCKRGCSCRLNLIFIILYSSHTYYVFRPKIKLGFLLININQYCICRIYYPFHHKNENKLTRADNHFLFSSSRDISHPWDSYLFINTRGCRLIHFTPNRSRGTNYNRLKCFPLLLIILAIYFVFHKFINLVWGIVSEPNITSCLYQNDSNKRTSSKFCPKNCKWQFILTM